MNLAVAFSTFGPPAHLQVTERELPVPGPSEVVVRVAAATVNPTDVLMLTGGHAALMKDLVPPWVAGMEFAGHVHQVGDGVDQLQVGDPVMGIVNPRRPQGGAQSRYVVLPAASVARLRTAHTLAEAATLPMNGLTAKMCLEQLALPAGATLLVTGATGAVGGYVIPLARRAGLRVAADGRPEDAALLRDLGAQVLLPRGDRLAEEVRAFAPDGVDGLVDGAVLGTPAAALVREGGAMVSLRRTQAITDPRIRHSTVSVMQRAGDTAALQWLAERLADGTLRPRIAALHTPDHAAEAFERVQRGGLRGRVVIDFGGASAT